MAGVHCGTRPLDASVTAALIRARRGAPSSLRVPLAACSMKRAPCMTVPKLRASQLAVPGWRVSAPRSLRTRLPVLMFTGQRWAHRPVAAQVSMPWYW
ncbi:hypothetical protein D9M71_475710 [compost metagenome]